MNRLNENWMQEQPTKAMEAEQLRREGLVCYHRASYGRALDLLSRAAVLYENLGDRQSQLELYTYTLRILAEQEAHAKIDALAGRVRELLTTTTLAASLRSRAHYILGVTRAFEQDGGPQARRDFEQSLAEALEGDDKGALAYPLFGLAFNAYADGNLSEARNHIERLMPVLEFHPNFELQVGTLNLRALIERNQKNYGAALTFLWEAYRSLSQRPNQVLFIHAVHGLGSVYLHKGELEIARHYLELARNAVLESECPRLHRMVNASFARLEAAKPIVPYDFCLDSERGVVLDRWGKALEIRDQFVLRDLITLFLKEPGRLFTKEEIVQRVWGETFDPAMHDNRVYVTVRRLRRILKTDRLDGEQIVQRAKGGYRLNPDLKVTVFE